MARKAKRLWSRHYARQMGTVYWQWQGKQRDCGQDIMQDRWEQSIGPCGTSEDIGQIIAVN